MDLRQLGYFVTIAEEGSITDAARRLHMTQPPLSSTVTQLERELGVTLLHRHARGVTPTPAGQHLLTHSRRLLADARRLREGLSAMGAGLRGELLIGAEPLGLWNLVNEAAQGFTTAHPDVDLGLTDAPPGQLLDLIQEGLVDVAIIPTADPVELASAAGGRLRAEVVKDVPLVLVAPRALRDELGEAPSPCPRCWNARGSCRGGSPACGSSPRHWTTSSPAPDAGRVGCSRSRHRIRRCPSSLRVWA